MNDRSPDRPRAEPRPASAPAAEPRPGDRVGPYRLVKLLGAGTGGRVFEVVHEKLGRPAALKLLDAGQAVRPSARARFLAEALAVNQISHPHIVEVSDVVEEDGHAALVMELLEGQSLASIMRSSSASATTSGPLLPPERFLPILAQVCEALAAAHAAGFVHRDLKPENVFLCVRPDQADFVKLLDFGVATTFSTTVSPEPERSVGEAERSEGWGGKGRGAEMPRGASEGDRGAGAPRQTFARAPGQIIFGTPAYASPEQAAGGSVDHTADIYAVGVMLYELACGQLPYEGWTTGQFLIQHLSAPVPRLPADMRATQLGQSLDAVIQRCMAKQPAERFGSAAELATTFAALAAGDFVTASATIPPLPSPRRPGHVYVSGGLAVAAILAVAWLAFHRGGHRNGLEVQPAPLTASTGAPSTVVAPFVTLTFTSEPPGAEVRAGGGELYGVTPFSRAFSQSDEKYPVEVSRAGYSSVWLSVSASATRTIAVTLARAPRPAPPKPSRRLGSEKTIDPFRR